MSTPIITTVCGSTLDMDDGRHTHECRDHTAAETQSHVCADCGLRWWHHIQAEYDDITPPSHLWRRI